MADYVLGRDTYYSYPGIVVSRVINAIIGIIEFFLALRLVLQLFGASPSAESVSWLYSFTATLMVPFAGAFPTIPLLGGVLDFSLIFAMIGYSIIGWLAIKLVSFLFIPVENF